MNVSSQWGEIICKNQNSFLPLNFSAHESYDHISVIPYIIFGRGFFGKNYTREIRIFFKELEQVLVYFVLPSPYFVSLPPVRCLFGIAR